MFVWNPDEGAPKPNDGAPKADEAALELEAWDLNLLLISALVNHEKDEEIVIHTASLGHGISNTLPGRLLQRQLSIGV